MDPRVLQAAERVMAWARAQVVAGLADHPARTTPPAAASDGAAPAQNAEAGAGTPVQARRDGPSGRDGRRTGRTRRAQQA